MAREKGFQKQKNFYKDFILFLKSTKIILPFLILKQKNLKNNFIGF
jgi:hypothetical protein